MRYNTVLSKTLLALLALTLILPVIPALQVSAEDGPDLVLVLLTEPSVINPFTYTSVYEQVVLEAIYEPLVRMAPDGSIVPNLAVSWTSENNTWTFYLRSDVVWHDGEPFNASDVAFTLLLAKQHPELQGGNADFYAALQNVVVENATVVKLVFNQTVPVLEKLASIYIVPKHVWETIPADQLAASLPEDKIIGCGPFKWSEHVPGSYIKLVRFDQHFRGTPEPASLTFKFVSSVDEAVNLIYTGEADAGLYYVYKKVHTSKLNELVQQGKAIVWQGLGSSTHVLMFNLRKYPFSEKAFRLAVALAINVTDIVTKYYGKWVFAAPGNLGFVSPRCGNFTWYAYKEDVYPYNPELAKKILTDVLGFKDVDGDGYLELPDGSDFKVHIIQVPNDAFYRDLISEDIANYLKAVGIDAEFTPIASSSDYWSMLAQRDFEMTVVGWVTPRSDRALASQAGWWVPLTFLSWLTSTEDRPGGGNTPGFRSREYDTIYAEFKNAFMSGDYTTAAYKAYELQYIIARDLPVIGFYHPYVVTAVRIDKYQDWVITAENYALNYWSYIGSQVAGLGPGPLKYGELSIDAFPVYKAPEDDILKLNKQIQDLLVPATLKKLGESVSSLSERVDELSGLVQQLNEQLSSLQNATTADIASIRSTLVTVATTLNTTAQTLQELSDTLSEMKNTLQTLSEDVSSAKEEASKAASESSDTASKVDSLASTVNILLAIVAISLILNIIGLIRAFKG
ncbi:hypothetical protein J4526_08690 [Desulfurococcaceae archaeon MEX13E-LK6-19]|nr:hypothetical protein J4526_08690 [Desulfurococcaceae archaeon MEX13E-LK6-19]